MTKTEFLEYQRRPYNVDMQQLFILHVEGVVDSYRLRNTDKVFLQAFLRDKNNRQLQQGATDVIEKVFRREEM